MDEAKVIQRKVQPATIVNEVKSDEKKKPKIGSDKPIHKACDSLFSWTSGFNNFEGFVNCGFLLLFVGGSRLFLENYIKYGVLDYPIQWIYELFGNIPKYHYLPLTIMCLSGNLHTITALLIEKGVSKYCLSAKLGLVFQVTNLCVMLLTPIVVFNSLGEQSMSFFGSLYICMIYFTTFLKLWSYIQVNGWCRELYELRISRMNETSKVVHGDNTIYSEIQSSKNDVTYPKNLSVQNLYYFMMSPTLCYELNFPRSDKIRFGFLCRRIVELICGIQLVYVLFQQWIIPSVKNSIIPFSNMDIIKIQERLLYLAIPNSMAWLISFYLFFHSFPNMVGEILRFGDRNFYQDWWNSQGIDEFWRTWNTPVHRWAVRHLYVPAIKATKSKFRAIVIVFLFSGLLHEYLISIPLRKFKIWAFCAMMAQLPLFYLCKFVVGADGGYRARWGNVIVWANLILGQPLCIMVYYYDHMATNYGPNYLESLKSTK